ncbi:hypothetical protein F5Y18DRAFT_418152 [Xylariaceae sp. FL1019]|nr:hypothetical protein F5Y18DRAFT_418152 [Xylariaceae sp. FL1019]
MKLSSASLAALLAVSSTVQCAPTHQFGYLRKPECADSYAAYLTGNVNKTIGLQSLVNPVIDCVLTQMPESRKAECMFFHESHYFEPSFLAASNLVLGLVPTILQSLGSTTVETALVGIRRPFLGFLVAAGSPTVAMAKSSDFAESLSTFVEGKDVTGIHIPGMGWSHVEKWAILITVVEHLMVAGAFANVIDLAYELGVHAVAVFAPDTVFGVPLWTFLAAIIHLASVLTIWLRVRLTPATDKDEHYRKTGTVTPSWLPTYFLPTAFQPMMQLEWKREHLLFHVLTWLISLGILIQVLFGTLVLSGLLFFSLVDSLTIVLRYILSAVLCRAVVKLELSGMKASLVPSPSQGSGYGVEVLVQWWTDHEERKMVQD